MTNRTKVFISYSHKDEAWKDRLMTHLRVLEFQFPDRLHIWVDTRISAGEDWRDRIQGALSDSKAAVLLVTANFLTSEFILNEEVPRLLENHARGGMRILPVLGKPCAWEVIPWLAKMQVRPERGRPISAGGDNQIDTDLMLVTYEVASLIGLIDDRVMGEQLASVNQRSAEPPERLDRNPSAAAIDAACIEIAHAARLLRAGHRAGTEELIYELIRLAISRGVPIYNSGARMGCAQIYAYTAKVILDLISHQQTFGQGEEARAIRAIKQSLERLDLQSMPIAPDSADGLAWKIRNAFDSILSH